MSPYQVFFRFEAAEVLRGISGPQRRAIISFIDALMCGPDMRGDYMEQDATGRDIQIKVVGGFAITYWPDHAVAEVKVVDIRRADG